MIGTIVAAVITAGLGFLYNMYKEKKNKENEFKAISLQAQKESLVAGKDLEVQIQQAQLALPAPKTKAELRAAMGLMCLCFVFLPSCADVSITAKEYKPVISIPDAKTLDEAINNGPEQLTPRESALSLYAIQTKMAVDTFNADAIFNDHLYGYPVTPMPGITQAFIDAAIKNRGKLLKDSSVK
jgi:hypothetical protein